MQHYTEFPKFLSYGDVEPFGSHWPNLAYRPIELQMLNLQLSAHYCRTDATCGVAGVIFKLFEAFFMKNESHSRRYIK